MCVFLCVGVLSFLTPGKKRKKHTTVLDVIAKPPADSRSQDGDNLKITAIGLYLQRRQCVCV